MKYLILTLSLVLLAGCTHSDHSEEPETTDVAVEYENSDYVGLSVPNAQAKAKAAEVSFRLVEIDGEPQAVTKDFRPGRINAKVEGGVITEYTVEGQE